MNTELTFAEFQRRLAKLPPDINNTVAALYKAGEIGAALGWLLFYENPGCDIIYNKRVDQFGLREVHVHSRETCSVVLADIDTPEQDQRHIDPFTIPPIPDIVNVEARYVDKADEQLRRQVMLAATTVNVLPWALAAAALYRIFR